MLTDQAMHGKMWSRLKNTNKAINMSEFYKDFNLESVFNCSSDVESFNRKIPQKRRNIKIVADMLRA